MVTPKISVVRIDFGFFVRPAEETGSGRARAEPVLGYLIEHPDGTLLVDTGIGEDPEVDRHYRPRRRVAPAALAAAGRTVQDIDLVVNCHLHVDHCGGNALFSHRPVFVQTVELAAARQEGYTLPQLIDAPGIVYEEIAGEVDVLPGVRIVPTPGHTDGHQSVVVTQPDGTVVVIAGQSHEFASAYSADALAVRASEDSDPTGLPITPPWMRYLCSLDPARVYFAHDHAVWMPE
jgi:N-acyl homoserine lactone hydrolase